MSILKIGVSSCLMYPDSTRPQYPKKTLQYMEWDLVQYLAKEEVFPVLIPEVSESLLRLYM